MNVSLTPEVEQFVTERVASGRNQTESEVVSEALRLLKERDDHARLRADIQAGFDEISRGQGREYDEAGLFRLAERVKAQGRAARAPKRR